MSQLVSQHAFQFLVVEQVENALRHGHRCVRRVASGGECVWGVGRNDIDLRHGNAHSLRQPLHDPVDARQVFSRHRLSAIHGQCNLVGKEIRDKVHHRRENQCDQHALLSAECTAEEQKQQRQHSEK